MTDNLEMLRNMLATDGYRLDVERGDTVITARVTADEGVCGDCLVPEAVLGGMLAKALETPVDRIRVLYPVEN